MGRDQRQSVDNNNPGLEVDFNTQDSPAADSEPLTETEQAMHTGLEAMNFSALDRNRGGIRTLPFSPETFQLMIRRFFIHGDITRTLCRSDLPSFSASKVKMCDYEAHGGYLPTIISGSVAVQ